MGGLSKNLMVRVGADLSGLVSGFNKASRGPSSFAKKTKADMEAVMRDMNRMKQVMANSTKNAEIVSLVDAIQGAEDRLRDMGEAGFSWGYGDFEDNVRELQSLKSRLNAYVEENFNAKSEAESIDDMKARLLGSIASAVTLGERLKTAKNALKEMDAAGLGAGDTEWDFVYKEVYNVTRQVKEYKDQLVHAGEVGEEVLDDTGDAARRLGVNARAAFSGVRRLVSWVGNLGRNAKSSDAGVDKLIRTVKQFGLVAVGIKLTKALFGELQGIVSRYVSENAALQAQVNTLKSGLGQALAPAINLVTNALSYLMPYIVGVSNAIGSLITNLFGSGWTTVADGANAAAAATGGATAAQEKYNRTLAGFDEITKLNSSNSAGGGGGASGTTTTQTAGKLPAWLTDLSTKIKEAISQEDYTTVGTLIGEKIAVGLNAAEKYLKSVNLSKVGKAIAQGINGAISALNNSDSSLGSVLASAIQVGVDGASSFVRNLDWSGLGAGIKRSLKDLFTGIDWHSVVSTMGATAGGIGTVIWEVIGAGVTSAKDYFWQHIEDAGYDTVQGILNGIVEGVLNIGGWIKDNIFKPFVEGFKATFDIHSPSKHKDIVSLGENIIAGILNGIVLALSNPVDWIKENVFQPLKEGFTKVFGGNGFKLDFSTDANLTSHEDNMPNKPEKSPVNLTSYNDILPNMSLDFHANLTSYEDNLPNKSLKFPANLTSYKDTLKNKSLKFPAKLTSYKDNLPNKSLDFKANVKKGWTGSIAKKLGIDTITSTIKSKLNMKMPKLTIDWGSATIFGKQFKYPKGFNIKWNARGLILNGAQLFGSYGNTLLGGGEAGREALLPLDRNTGWMDKIADRVALRVVATQSGPQEITINLVLDGKVIAKTVVNQVNAQAKATGKHPFAAYI